MSAQFVPTQIIATGHYVPEKILTNEDLEKIVDTTDEWITTRTGIKERHIAADDETTSSMAAKASVQALKNANLKAEDIDLIILASVTGDMYFPSTACIVQRLIGAKNACCFDISAACSGFLYSIQIARHFINTGNRKTAIVIGAEKLSSLINWEDRNTCVLFGDGAGAAILQSTSEDAADGQRGRILSSVMGSDGELSDILSVPGGGVCLSYYS